MYFNDFNSGATSLNGLSVVDTSPPGFTSTVGVVSGQLEIDLGSVPYTYVVANTASFAAPYTTTQTNQRKSK